MRACRQRRGARLALTVALVLIVPVSVAAGAVIAQRPWSAGAAPQQQPPVTAQVEYAALTSRLRLNAQLSYGDAVPLPVSAGVITVPAVAGAELGIGERVYEADGKPVVLLKGDRPFWREIGPGTEPGEDVRQLQRSLADAGVYSGPVDGAFGSRTAAALRAWQASVGQPRSGVLAPSDVVVSQTGRIRIAQATGRRGQSGVSPGGFTEATLRATARLTAAQVRELAPGTPVTVTMPDGTAVEAAISSTDPGGVPTGDGDKTTPAVAVIELPPQNGLRGSGQTVRVTVADPRSSAEPTLVVPVTALLADAQGGYAVEIVRDGVTSRVAVEIGTVADGRVQVLRSGAELPGHREPALAQGDTVVLAS